jgi:hypothetical protein
MVPHPGRRRQRHSLLSDLHLYGAGGQSRSRCGPVSFPQVILCAVDRAVDSRASGRAKEVDSLMAG